MIIEYIIIYNYKFKKVIIVEVLTFLFFFGKSLSMVLVF